MTTTAIEAPKSEAELVERAKRIAGFPLGAVAKALAVEVPFDQKRAKGWVGNLIETALGATAGVRSQPDFEAIGVELKTIPVDAKGRPKESTYLTTVPLRRLSRMCWEDSEVKRKLARVLWVPIEADRSLALGARRIGNPLLWSPSADEETILRRDYEALAELIAAGYVDSITAHRGESLQIRPKADNARARTWGEDAEGAPMRTLPRGFYLRKRFTQAILEKHFALT
jgi:DNA mismatch repair protein MutH